ncbi:retrovirus-related pol polyprotein from transposon TNT 1-94 [Tanacetum coccineum]
MVVTRNTSLESHIDDSVKNWVTEHVSQVFNGMNAQFETVTSSLSDRVKQFFAVDNVHEEEKVKIASIHPHDKALTWYLQFIKMQGENVAWTVYEEAILKRFGPINEDQMAELKNLRYGTNMKDYQSQFEQLLTQVDVTESQLVSLFIAGLPANIEVNVRMFRPKTLVDAMSLANFQEASLVVVKNRTAPLLPTPKTNPPYYAYRNVNYPTNSTTLALPAPTNQLVTKHPAITEVPPTKQLSQKELAEKGPKPLSPWEEEGELALELEFELGETDEFTTRKPELMRRNVGKHLLHLLMDTGSIHNFLNIYTAKKLGCKMSKTYPLMVTVPGGNKLVSQYMVYGFQWSINGQVFKTAVMLLPLGGCEIVLGFQWLSTLDVFAIPSTLPPSRDFDHSIPLKDESTAVNIKRYRYPPNQKNAIEAMVKELLDTCVKNAFQWSPEAQIAFETLQQAMLEAPVLSLTNFNEEFIIETDASRITTPFQSKWLPKLLGFDYEIEYKKGKENVVVDAFSRIERQGELCELLSAVTSNEFMDAVTLLWTIDPVLSHIVQTLKDGHSGVQATLKPLGAFFYWKGMRKMVKETVRTCDVCQRNKANLSSYLDFLQPLLIPTKIWKDISMDFIDSLPTSHGKTGTFPDCDAQGLLAAEQLSFWKERLSNSRTVWECLA